MAMGFTEDQVQPCPSSCSLHSPSSNDSNERACRFWREKKSGCASWSSWCKRSSTDTSACECAA